MTDLSGIGSNKTFKTSLAPNAPYYYISTHLDLSGVVVPSEGITYYFNKDNNLGYMLTSLTPGIGYEDYHKFHMIDENAVIGEVVIFSNPDLVEGTVTVGKEIKFRIGGAETTTDPVLAPDTWGGITGFFPGLVGVSDVNTGSICYFGHEGGGLAEDKKFLAVTITEELIPGAPIPDAPIVDDSTPVEDDPVIVDAPRALRTQKKAKSVRVVVPPTIASGSLNVVIKVFPKYQ